MQQHFFTQRYSFQRVPNQVEKLQKFQGVGGGGGYNKHPMEWKFQGCGGPKAKVLGGGMDMFWNYKFKKTGSNHFKNSLGFTVQWSPVNIKGHQGDMPL